MLKLQFLIPLTTGGQVAIEADGPQEAHRALVYLGELGVIPTNRNGAQPAASDSDAQQGAAEGSTEDPAPVEQVAAAQAATSSEPAEKPKRGRGRPRNSEATATPASAPAAAPTAAPTVTAADITVAITNLANATSLATAKSVLTQFGVNRAAELKPEQYAAFAAACKEAAEQAPEPSDADLL